MCAAVQNIGCPVRQAATDRKHGFIGIVLGRNQIGVGRLRGGAGEINKVRRIAAVEREIDHALLVDHLADAGAARFNRQRGCFDLHLLRHRAELLQKALCLAPNARGSL